MRLKKNIFLVSIISCVTLLSLNWAYGSATSSSPNSPAYAQLGAPHALSPGFYGINIDNTNLNFFLWSSPRVRSVIVNKGIQTLRFPGGDFSNYYDWHSGWAYPNFIPDPIFNGMGSPAQGHDSLADYASLSLATNTRTLFALNVVTAATASAPNGTLISPNTSPSDLALIQNNQVAMLQAASKQGLPVDYIELGNELFWNKAQDGGNVDQVYTYKDSVDYATQMNSWIAVLHAHFPQIQIAAIGAIAPGGVTVPNSTGTDRINSWNTGVLENIKGISALTLHRYDETTWDKDPADVLSLVFTDWAAIQEKVLPQISQHGLQAWFTEFGGFTDDTGNLNADGTWRSLPVYTGTWLRGIYTAQMLVQFLSDPRVGQIELYNLSDLYFQSSSQQYWESGNPPGNAQNPQGGIVTFTATKGDQTAMGHVCGLIGRAITGGNVAYPVLFPSIAMIEPKVGNPYPAVTGVWVGNANEPGAGSWVLINFSSVPQVISFSSTSWAVMESLWAPSLMTVVNSNTSLNHTYTAIGKDQTTIELPPYSVNRITIK